jgi:hypothetical protein
MLPSESAPMNGRVSRFRQSQFGGNFCVPPLLPSVLKELKVQVEITVGILRWSHHRSCKGSLASLLSGATPETDSRLLATRGTPDLHVIVYFINVIQILIFQGPHFQRFLGQNRVVSCTSCARPPSRIPLAWFTK